MQELKVVKMDNEGEKQYYFDTWELVYKGDNFALFHHTDHCVYYRKVDEFFLFMLEEDKKIIEKCQQYISLYNKAVEKVRKIEFDFFENHSSEKYPNGKVNRIWKNLEEQWKKIKDQD